jgi:hypothetical protein
MRLRSFSVLLTASSLLFALAGCSGTTSFAGTGAGTSASSGTGSTSGTGAGGSTGTGTGTDTGAGSAFDAGATVTSYKTGMGPIALQPGDEQTNCITVHLGNAEGGFVRRFRAELSEGSHHMIVYQSADTTESLTPTPCAALGGILMGEHPVFIAQQANAELDYPTDENGVPVGFQLAANQMVRIEFHTINTTTTPLMVTGSAYLDTVPLSTKVTLSDLAFWGTTKINIPPMASAHSGTAAQPVLYQTGIPGTKSFAVTTHQHHLGTEIQVWYGTGATDTSDPIADNKDWSNPALVLFDPPLDFPADASKGLSFECHWNNTGTTAVHFGESFNDEMCFVWHYYYPSQGFQFCADGNCG